jgi:hypothetical protein
LVLASLLPLIFIPACSSLSSIPPTTFCGNAYWPIKEGATWVFPNRQGTTTSVLSVSNISGYEVNSTADLLLDGHKVATLHCLRHGIQTDENDDLSDAILALPNEQDIRVGDSWSLTGDKLYKDMSADVREIVRYTTPAGSFDAVHICIHTREEGEQACTYSAYFAKDVGLVGFMSNGGYEFKIKEYYIPE